eukprot:3006120-Alexandrium_andersonii.AAC.1
MFADVTRRASQGPPCLFRKTRASQDPDGQSSPADHAASLSTATLRCGARTEVARRTLGANGAMAGA